MEFEFGLSKKRRTRAASTNTSPENKFSYRDKKINAISGINGKKSKLSMINEQSEKSENTP